MPDKINELVIFDWDDTLMNTIAFLRAPLHQALFEYVKEHLEPDISREDFDLQSNEFYAELRSTIKGWSLKHNQPPEFVKAVHERANRPMVEAVIAVTIRNEERLARLRRLKELGYKLVILTHNEIGFCWPLMEEYGYTEFFGKEDVYHISRVMHLKVVVDSYQYVLNDLNHAFDKVHMVDDTDINLECAKLLGMDTYHVLGENPLSEAAKAYTDQAHNSVDDVMDYLIRRAA